MVLNPKKQLINIILATVVSCRVLREKKGEKENVFNELKQLITT